MTERFVKIKKIKFVISSLHILIGSFHKTWKSAGFCKPNAVESSQARN